MHLPKCSQPVPSAHFGPAFHVGQHFPEVPVAHNFQAVHFVLSDQADQWVLVYRPFLSGLVRPFPWCHLFPRGPACPAFHALRVVPNRLEDQLVLGDRLCRDGHPLRVGQENRIHPKLQVDQLALIVKMLLPETFEE